MTIILLNSNQQYVLETHVATLGLWQQEYNYNCNVSKSIHS